MKDTGKGLSVGTRIRSTYTIFFAILVFISLIYSNTLKTPFVFDDLPNISENPHIRLNEMNLEGLRDAGFGSILSNRPVAYISLALNYYVHRYSLPGYHIVNIAIHILAAIFLWMLFMETLKIVRERMPGSFISESTDIDLIAFVAVAIWMVHPIQTQSVTYIVQRMTSMASMFYILSMLCYVKARLRQGVKTRYALYFGALLSGLLAISSKEIAITLPFFIFLYEFYFFQGLDLEWIKKGLPYVLGVIFAAVVLAVVYSGFDIIGVIQQSYEIRDFTIEQRVLTEFRVVVFYIGLLLFPHPGRLTLEHDIRLSHSLVDPITTLLSMIFIACAVVLGLFLARRQRIISFCILWFFGNLALESSVLGLELMFEHRTYLPSTFTILLAVLLANRCIRQQWIKVGLLCIILVILSIWTYQRNMDWKDEETFLRDCVEKSPEKKRPHNNLGNILIRDGKVDDGIEQLKEALRIDQEYMEAHNNIGVGFLYKNMLEDAITHFGKALEIQPGYTDANKNLKKALERKKKLDEAIDRKIGIIRKDPKDHNAMKDLAILYSSKAEYEKAIETLNKTIRLWPYDSETYYNMACVYALKGDRDKSVEYLGIAIDKGFNDRELMDNDNDLDSIRSCPEYKGLIKDRGLDGHGP